MPIQAAATPASTVQAPTLEQRVADLSLYAESGDAVAEGEIWYVPETAQVFGEDGLTFADVLDIVNPLHHLPVVGAVYRAATGDDLAPGSRMLGGALFGGVLGFVAGLVNAVIEDETGSDLGEKAVALIQGKNNTTPETAGADPNRVAQTDGAGSIDIAAGAAQAAVPVAPQGVLRTDPIGPRPGGIPGAIPHTPATAPAAPADPTEALIRARVAVPPSGKIPSDTALWSTKSHPRRPSLTAAGPVAQRDPVRLTKFAPAGATRPEPVAKPVRDPAQPAAVPPSPTAPAAATVPALMRDALDKYEKLMRVRHRPTVADDI